MRHRLGNLVNRLGRRELALIVIGALVSAVAAKLVDTML
ncbi:hypothetical protein OEIGOIKO_03435 [Streptomyces chrestomyceticus JCM 4735]|uniref:Uncharacterized protein n=1 Tax=Streptomyces chrestomyceticus JCM 4735 TaxID=1306181 RepID=A0A7U9KUN0_9ACTN|nr:hypothetical protein OEIGOIKO_03435 [Streptomyces chrestomyceticus JCM 4735]